MNLTKEQMLEWFDSIQLPNSSRLTRRELREETLMVAKAIRYLIESSGDKRGPSKCPVCEGTGWLPTAPPPGATNPTSIPCHSCKGAGWILPYGPFCLGATTSAPSPGPSGEKDGMAIEPLDGSVRNPPAPLPAEVEEAMERMADVVREAFWGRSDERAKDESALAVIRAALSQSAPVCREKTDIPCQTIKVTRGWFDDLMSEGWVIGEYSDRSPEKAIAMLREKGIVIEEKPTTKVAVSLEELRYIIHRADLDVTATKQEVISWLREKGIVIEEKP